MKQALLHVLDEVNVKIEGLDLDVRKKLSDTFKFEVPGARYMPAVRLGRWDGKVGFFQLGGSTYINLLADILPILEQYNYDVDLEDYRDYQRSYDLEPVNEDSYSDYIWPPGHPQEGQQIKLRDYQVEVINKFLDNPQCLQEIATGAGKTLCTAVLSHRCEAHGRTIVIVPNKSLVTQTEADYVNMGLDVGVFFGDRKEFGKTHTICTWQSLNVLLKKTRAKDVDITIGEFLHDVVCVMVDEVHMAKADALKTLLTGPMSRVPIRWGLTGTIPKEEYERMSLRCSIGDVVGRLSANELQQEGVLANCHVNVLQLVDHAEYRSYQEELRYLLETEERMSYVAQLIDKVRHTGNTLVLVDRIAPGKHLTELVPDAVFVSGSTKAKARKEEYDEVADASDKVIVATYGVAAVGINIPRIFNLVLIEPGKSFVRVIQSIGRGIRKAEDKDFVQIWDITSTCKFAKRHLTKRKAFYREANYPFEVEKIEWK
ncbi:MAG: DEAD/DEAH box helicase [Euryarchaeota archaeon]|jgi:superfamily II DNA or RNA helicase|nr:DEAD/DEAH box helicase [Euryarchaeota archaeon]